MEAVGGVCLYVPFSLSRGKWALSPKFQREDLVRGQSTKGKLEDTLNLHQDPRSHSKWDYLWIS